MKKATLSISVVLAALAVSGCQNREPLSPEATIFLARASSTPFTAVGALQNVVDPGEVVVTPGGVLHVRNQVVDGPLTGDLTGTLTVTSNDVSIVLNKGDGEGPGHGTFTITAAEGEWSGRFEGQVDGPVFAGHFQAQGTGASAGTTIQGTFTDEANPVLNLFVLSGFIRDPNGG